VPENFGVVRDAWLRVASDAMDVLDSAGARQTHGKENADTNTAGGGSNGSGERQRASSIELLARLMHLAEVARLPPCVPARDPLQTPAATDAAVEHHTLAAERIRLDVCARLCTRVCAARGETRFLVRGIRRRAQRALPAER